jgi:hypothetical protein
MATGAPRHTPLPAEQATLISARSQELLPSVGDLTSRLATADAQGRKLIVKFGIDPTAADVHVGHAVPMIIASRFQRGPAAEYADVPPGHGERRTAA